MQREPPAPDRGWLAGDHCRSPGYTGLPVLSSVWSPVARSEAFSVIPRVSGVPSAARPPVWIPGTSLPGVQSALRLPPIIPEPLGASTGAVEGHADPVPMGVAYPEPAAAWGRTDSLIDEYRANCTAVKEVRTLRQLADAIGELA